MYVTDIDMAVETTTLRINTLKIALIGTTIAGLIGAGIITENQLITDNIVRGQAYTDNEYVQLKQNIISIMDNRNITPPTFEEGEIWKEMLAKHCKNLTLTNVISSGDLLSKLNNALNTKCI